MYNVVIVEDDPMVRLLNRNYVESHGGLNLSASFSNGKDAIEYLSTHQENVDLVMLDVYMPIMDGRELIQLIRKNGIDCGIILVTAANDSKTFTELSAYGLIDYLVKPFDEARLHSAFDKFITWKNLAGSKKAFSQEDIDKLYSSVPSDSTPHLMQKGIQDKTLGIILDFLADHPGAALTSEIISEEIGISRVTIRRYMNYMVENGDVESSIDYSTGGRPSILYTYRKH